MGEEGLAWHHKPVTLVDVAARAGVSPATVSRHFNGHVVRNAQAIQQAIDELQFRPSEAARALKSGKTHSVVVLGHDLRNTYYSYLLEGIEGVAGAAGYTVFFRNLPADERTGAVVDDLLRRVDGVVLSPRSESDPVAVQLSRAGLPIVLVAGQVTGLAVDVVTPDNEAGARSAASYLAQLGHRRIAIINSPPERTAGRVRREGFVAGLAAHGLSLPPELELAGPYGRDGGYSAMVRLLSLPAGKRPTAVFSSGSLVTIGALRAVRESGITMPDELSLISFDDYELFDALTPPLTVVDQPMAEQGAVAMRLLLERLDDPSRPPRSVVLATPLILRGSCAPPRPGQ